MTGELLYLDHNATTPLDPRVAEAMRPFLETGWGNPSSAHAEGRTARAAVEQARASLAALLGADPAEIVFTGGGTESNNLAITGSAERLRASGRSHLVISAVEHPAVDEVCRHLESRHGCRVTRIGVDAAGRVDAEEVERALGPETALVSVMHANNEVGTLQPLAEIAARARRHGVRVHTDAAQSVGKVPTRVDELGVDLLTVAGHKLYGPKGVGALYVRRGTPLVPVLFGAGHEGGLRPGTENVLGIVGLGAAAELAAGDLPAEGARQATLRDRLEALLESAVPGLVRLGDRLRRLPNTSSLSFPGVRAGDLLAATPELAASAGAACHAEGVAISSVLAAMGVPEAVAAGVVRLSLGRGTDAETVDRAAAALAGSWRRLAAAGR